jgi:hypothetical protein
MQHDQPTILYFHVSENVVYPYPAIFRGKIVINGALFADISYGDS